MLEHIQSDMAFISIISSATMLSLTYVDMHNHQE
jgi:hypothetical protein